jgi:hypothetical protein
MKKKKLFFPEQLKAALKYGYKIELINGHEFSRFNLFNEYIYHFYNIILEKKTKSIGSFLKSQAPPGSLIFS